MTGLSQTCQALQVPGGSVLHLCSTSDCRQHWTQAFAAPASMHGRAVSCVPQVQDEREQLAKTTRS